MAGQSRVRPAGRVGDRFGRTELFVHPITPGEGGWSQMRVGEIGQRDGEETLEIFTET